MYKYSIDGSDIVIVTLCFMFFRVQVINFNTHVSFSWTKIRVEDEEVHKCYGRLVTHADLLCNYMLKPEKYPNSVFPKPSFIWAIK